MHETRYGLKIYTSFGYAEALLIDLIVGNTLQTVTRGLINAGTIRYNTELSELGMYHQRSVALSACSIVVPDYAVVSYAHALVDSLARWTALAFPV